MNREDIIRMALEAGCKPFEFGATIAHVEDLERFATLVASAEREACAKVCEEAIASIWEYSPEDVKHTGTNVCNNLASAIRARSNT